MSEAKIEISKEALAAMYAHARATYPDECCGFLRGGATGPLDEATRIENRQNELHRLDSTQFPRDARTAYNMAPRDILALQKSFDSPRPVRVIYHSHIDVGAYFSAEDTRAAIWEGEPIHRVDYLVIDAQADRIAGAKLFRFDRASSTFVEIGAFPGE